MSVRPCPVLLKSSDMLQGKNPSSGLRFEHENIAFTNTTPVTKIMWLVLQPNCNMYVMIPLLKPCIHAVMTDKSLFGLPVF